MLPCLSLLCVAIFGPWSLVAPDPAAVPKAAISVQGYGARNPGCAAWTDQCVVCKAGSGGGTARCSLPGIACTPGPTVCQQTAP